MINRNKAKAVALMVLLLAVALVTGGCKAATSPRSAPAAPAAPVVVTTTDLPPDRADSDTPDDKAPIDETCTGSGSFNKVKFVFHAGTGFAVFHYFIWSPYKDGKFTNGTKVARFATWAKGGMAAWYVMRSIKLAVQDAKNDPTLCKVLVAPLAAIGDKVQAAFTKFRKGDDSGVKDLETSIDTVEKQAQAQPKIGTFTEPNPQDIDLSVAPN